jgi:hypothetical protein
MNFSQNEQNHDNIILVNKENKIKKKENSSDFAYFFDDS